MLSRAILCLSFSISTSALGSGTGRDGQLSRPDHAAGFGGVDLFYYELPSLDTVIEREKLAAFPARLNQGPRSRTLLRINCIEPTSTATTARNLFAARMIDIGSLHLFSDQHDIFGVAIPLLAHRSSLPYSASALDYRGPASARRVSNLDAVFAEMARPGAATEMEGEWRELLQLDIQLRAARRVSLPMEVGVASGEGSQLNQLPHRESAVGTDSVDTDGAGTASDGTAGNSG